MVTFIMAYLLHESLRNAPMTPSLKALKRSSAKLQDEDMNASLKQLVRSPSGIATVVVESVSFAAMLPFVYIEVQSIREYGSDWLSSWNVLDVIAYANQVRPFQFCQSVQF